MTLVFLGGLPLPILAVALGAYVLTRGLFVEEPASPLLTSQLLLFMTAVLVVGAGGFLIWRTLASLGGAAHVAEPETESGRDAPAHRGPVQNSVSRMLTTIERQSGELDSAHRELESVRAQLRETSFIDEVTKLHNRRFLSVRLEEEVARYRRYGRPVSLVLVALDYRPLRGGRDLTTDEMRCEVAQALSKTSRGVDVICHHGGNVFSVLLVETAQREARAYAERLSDLLSTMMLGRERHVIVSLGISSLSEGLGVADDLLEGAEEALGTARRTETRRVAVWAGSDTACKLES